MLLLGPQYSFDVGWGESGAQELRYMYTAKISGVYRILGGWCTMPSGSANMVCTHEPAWTGHTVPGQSDYPGDQFNPIVKYGDGRWIVSYHTRQDDPSGNTVSIWEAQLVRTPTASSTKAQVVPAQTVCSRCDGYWGDYDEIAYAGINPDNQQRVFYRPYTDSSRGCTARRNYYATDMHVSVAPISVQ